MDILQASAGLRFVRRPVCAGRAPVAGFRLILKAESEKLLSYTYWSSMSGVPDVPENYKTVTFELAQQGTQTLLKLNQSNSDEKSQAHSTENWQMVLDGLKKVAERL